MSLEQIWDWLARADLFTLGIGLFFVGFVLWVAYGIVNWLIKRFSHDPTVPQRWWNQCSRFAILLGPGVLFLVWCPYHLFTASNGLSGVRALALLTTWLAWPILGYKIGHQDGKQEVQHKLDAVYTESARVREHRSQQSSTGPPEPEAAAVQRQEEARTPGPENVTHVATKADTKLLEIIKTAQAPGALECDVHRYIQACGISEERMRQVIESAISRNVITRMTVPMYFSDSEKPTYPDHPTT